MYKLLILIDGISNSGGTDRVASTLSSLLSNHQYEVTLFSLNPGDPFYPVDNKVSIRYPKSSVRILKLLEFIRYAKNMRPDGIMIISMGKLSVQALLLSKLFRIKSRLICCDHVSIETFSTAVRKLKVFCYGLAEKVVVLTHHDKNYLTSSFSLKNVHVVGNMSPFHHENSLNRFDDVFAQKQNRVLAVGRLTYQKNFGRLLDIWKNVNKQGWKLLIVGDGEEKTKLLEKIKKYQLEESAEIVSPSKNISEYYRSSGVIAMTSRYEGLPMVLIEAKNYALPAIAFDCKTGPAEIIKDDGYVINYESDNAFTDRLNQLIESNDLRKEFAQTAWHNSVNYGPELILRKWNEILN
ncbi:glycosyltransferase family 4 protein [Erwinia pyrifoliae]|uniref:glycosyltransferase family 4 protein n=1 Tax=Erwinia pyrifoliae TaxID=79967 RepID=UPI002209CE68|nr:glycosyltransferase family 4 protein [Erwinia pyrifoliae]UWS31463.1 glycosyltransferase family 4 protein [Erwinia pyrifoliae]